MPPNNENGQADPYLFLLTRIDKRQEEQGKDIREVRDALAAGQVRFENHEGRIKNLESTRATARAEPSTDRTQRSAKPESERLSVGAWLKVLAAFGAVAALVIGAYVTGQSKAAEAPSAQHKQGP